MANYTRRCKTLRVTIANACGSSSCKDENI